jgi:hypothetical protein
MEMNQLLLVLHSNKSIKTLMLVETPISDRAIYHFIELWNKQESRLRKLGFQRNSVSQRGAQMLIQAAANYPTLESLSLARNDSIGYDGLELIGRELGNVQLRELAISSCIPVNDDPDPDANEMFTASRALADGLKANHTIQSLNWHCVEFGPEGLRILMRATAHRQVLLNIIIDVASGFDIVAIGDELRHAQLGELVLTNTRTDYVDEDPFYGAFSELAHGLSNSRTLSAFTLSLNYSMPSNDAEQLMRAVGSHPSIQRLHLLTQGEMRMDGLQTIGEQLANATTLKSLSLNGFLEDEFERGYFRAVDVGVVNGACLALANGVRSNRSLQELNLFHRYLQFPHALEVVRAATNHPSLQKLTLSLKLSISLIEVGQLAAALGTLQLKEFLTDFRCLPSSDEEKSEQFMQVRDALLEGVKSNVYLHKLTIPGLGLEQEIQFYIEQNRLGRLGLI